MTRIRIDIEAQDIDLDVIAEQVVMDCGEEDMLLELARENHRLALNSGDSGEVAFALAAETKLKELAKWFQENQR